MTGILLKDNNNISKKTCKTKKIHEKKERKEKIIEKNEAEEIKKTLKARNIGKRKTITLEHKSRKEKKMYPVKNGERQEEMKSSWE